MRRIGQRRLARRRLGARPALVSPLKSSAPMACDGMLQRQCKNTRAACALLSVTYRDTPRRGKLRIRKSRGSLRMCSSLRARLASCGGRNNGCGAAAAAGRHLLAALKIARRCTHISAHRSSCALLAACRRVASTMIMTSHSFSQANGGAAVQIGVALSSTPSSHCVGG